MTRIARAAVAAATVVVLTGCVSTHTTTVGTPTAVADSVPQTGFAAAGSDLAAPVADQTVFPAVAAPAEAPDTTGPAAAGAVVESMVWVPAGDHRVPGTVTVPACGGGVEPAEALAGAPAPSRRLRAPLMVKPCS